MLRSLFKTLFVLVSLFAASAAWAHRQPEALTTIEFNKNTDSWEIVHRFHAHDAERALSEIRDKIDFNLETLEDRARFALYVEETFEIRNAETQKPIPLTLVGATLEDQDILVFQETKTQLPSTLSIRHNALREYFPKQTNTVNLTIDSKTLTLVFAGEDKWKALVPRQ